MENNFETAFDFAMKWEKARSDDPKDPGGLTIWGISSKYYPQIVNAIKDLPPEEAREKAKQFYHDEIWIKLSCDRTASPLDMVLFDTAIIPGPGAALAILKITHDWMDFLFLRLGYFVHSPSAHEYLKGWANRVLDLFKTIRKI